MQFEGVELMAVYTTTLTECRLTICLRTPPNKKTSGDNIIKKQMNWYFDSYTSNISLCNQNAHICNWKLSNNSTSTSTAQCAICRVMISIENSRWYGAICLFICWNQYLLKLPGAMKASCYPRLHKLLLIVNTKTLFQLLC